MNGGGESGAIGTAAYLELGSRRVFACALEWPGWCRAGKDESLALEALDAYIPRYAVVAAEAGIEFPSAGELSFEVVERLTGTAGTDFGVPEQRAASDFDPLDGKDAERLTGLVRAAWAVFDRVVAGASAELRKGPRGGGRGRDAIVEHVLGAEVAYASKLGVRLRQPSLGDIAAISAHRDAIIEGLRSGTVPEKGWPPRYAARRIAWHVLDHAWEIEDRTEPAPG